MKTTKQIPSLVVLMVTLLFSAEILAGHKGDERSGWNDRHEQSYKSNKHNRHKYKQHHKRHHKRHHERRAHHEAHHDEQRRSERHHARHHREESRHTYRRGMKVLFSVGEPGRWFYTIGLRD